MLEFLSFIVTLSLFAGVLVFIAMTIRNASKTIINALIAPTAIRTKTVKFDRQPHRSSPVQAQRAAPLSAAA